MKVLCYVQHLLGIGHVMRFGTIVRALCDEGVDVHVAFGGFPVVHEDFGNAKVHYLPPVKAQDQSFSVLVDENGREIDEEWKAKRAEILVDLYRDIKPDGVLIELFPFGRSQFRKELLALLEEAKDVGTYCSVRDILVAKDNEKKNRRMVDWATAHFDHVFVHSDPDFVPFEFTFPHPDELRPMIAYTGYVADDRSDLPVEECDDIVVSVGGGAVGTPIVNAMRDALPLLNRDLKIRVLIGGDFPEEEQDILNGLKRAGCVVEAARKDFPALLKQARLSISMGGYNTIMDVLKARVPAIVIPFSEGHESEQTLRASLLQEREVLTMIEQPDLTGEKLADHIIKLLNENNLHAPIKVNMNGAQKTASLIKDDIRTRTRCYDVMD